MAPYTLLLCFHSLAYSLLIAYVILSKWRVYSLLFANVQMAGVDTIWELHTLPVIKS